MNNAVLAAVLIAVALYQLYVTVRVFMSNSYSTAQKFAQLALIWLLPFLGAVVCHAFLGADEHSSEKHEDGFIPTEAIVLQVSGQMATPIDQLTSNRAAHPDAREASRLVSPSEPRAGGRER